MVQTSSAAKWLCLSACIQWVLQIAEGTKEISSFLDIENIEGNWKVKEEGLVSRGEFAKPVPLGPDFASSLHTKLTVYKMSTFMIQKHTTKEIEQVLNGTDKKSVLESLSAVLFKKSRSSAEPAFLVQHFMQLIKNEALKGIISSTTSSSMAGAIVTLVSDGAKGNLCNDCNRVSFGITNKTSFSVRSGSKAILEAQVPCNTESICKSNGTLIFPNSTQIKQLRFQTSVWKERRKGFVLIYDAVMYDKVNVTNQTSIETDWQRSTGVVVRFILVNQDSVNKIYTFAQNCTGIAKDGDTNPNCTFASGQTSGQGTHSDTQNLLVMTFLAGLFLSAISSLQG